ncbi:MAG: diterpene synthase [Anaerolineae bacterium]|nr:diterpene synthase [Anaerolineae bacterium]
MDFETFQQLPTAEIARLVKETGPKVCVFPINGTRRWFILEYPEEARSNFAEAYMRLTWRRQIELYRLIFDHGIETLLTPIFGPDLLERGEEYAQLILPGLLWCARDQELLDFYAAYDVRVRVYGDARRYLQDTPYAAVLEAYEELAQRTASHRSFRLFFGVCAHDATETVAEIGIRFYQQHGRAPNRREIVEAYYGEYLEPVDIFIGFDRPAAFDMPLLATGSEDLYFTVSPSPYLDTYTLRTILYDHMYSRRVDESGYSGLTPEELAWMRNFYRANLGRVLGVGVKRGGVWYPLPQVEFPNSIAGGG